MSNNLDRLLVVFGLRSSPPAGRASRAALALLAVMAGYVAVGGFGDASILRILGGVVFLSAAVGFVWSLFWHLD
jgi:hypothetical protein